MELFRNSRKGQSAYLITGVGFFFAVVFLFVNIYSQVPPQATTRFIGDLNLQVLHVYQDSRESLLFVDQSAKLAAEQVGFGLAADGGFVGDSPCGRFSDEGLNVWKPGSCLPSSSVFSQEMGPSLSFYLDNFLITENNHEKPLFEDIDFVFYFRGFDVVGAAQRGVRLKILLSGLQSPDEDTKLSAPSLGDYHVRPSFHVLSGFNFSELPRLVSRAEALHELCVAQEDVGGCVRNESRSLLLGSGWSFCELAVEADLDGRVFPFCLQSPHLVFAPAGNLVEKQPVVYRFALDLSLA